MSQNTYFRHPQSWRTTVFVSIDRNERRRLTARGWTRIARDDAIDLLGGLNAFKATVHFCKTGEMEMIPGFGCRCHGHGASRS